ncbi:RecX family transcriptional regulator [Gorillibacterium timonense]|uniref:RecX family transcriptional regulator n=1 Tax=Gorillibacterium timonense TaxID=1689269 RepID=UPI00071CDBFB|nr:RecX family transcriptional regulator [Gorillibacterium timonense]
MAEQEEQTVAVITQVEQQKKNRSRYNLYLDGEYALSVHEDLLIQYRLLKGESVDKIRLEEILQADEKHRAYLDAIRFISVRSRSIDEVRKKLKTRGYEPPMIQQVLDQLGEQGYLNDLDFAELWTKERITLQKKGRKWVEQELRQKGVNKQIISDAIGRIDPEEEKQQALTVATKRWKLLSGEPADKKRKLFAFLARRGYSPQLVSAVVKEVSAGETISDDWEWEQE